MLSGTADFREVGRSVMGRFGDRVFPLWCVGRAPPFATVIVNQKKVSERAF
jgi:hypothetical protein